MQRINEMKSIMRKLKEIKNESVEEAKTDVAVVEEAKTETPVNEAVAKAVNEDDNGVTDEIETENDASENDLLMARLEDLVARLERLAPAEDEAPAEETPAEEEEAPAEEEGGEEETEGEGTEEEGGEEEVEEESYERSLEERLAALERRFTESRRRSLCRRFNR